MGSTDFSQYEKEYSKLLDPAEPLDSRIRELYRLKESILKTSAGVHVLSKAMDASGNSVLLQHEIVYNIGQSGLPEACPALERLIRDPSYDPVTRHEAIEALGAIASFDSRAILSDFADPAREPHAAVRESCELALQRLADRAAKGDAAVQPPPGCRFVSVDPAPAFREGDQLGDELGDELGGELGGDFPAHVPALERLLCDDTGATCLYRRYQAMFSLRNIGTPEAVGALSRALRADTRSALFRHEVAFVLGQLEHPASEAALVEALRDEEEAPMVRHEAAEALGAIANPKLMSVLEEFATHKEPIVRDSCVVAIEMHKYWSQFNNNVA